MEKLGELLDGDKRQGQQKELGKALSQSAAKRSAQLSRPRQMKPLALEKGLVPAGKDRPYLYRDPNRPELLFTGALVPVNEEEVGCWKCWDARYVKMAPPATRPSKGAWDSELVPCEACEEG